MIWLFAFLIGISLLSLAVMIDNKIHNKASVVVKFLSISLTVLLIIFSLLLIGESWIQTLMTKGVSTNNEVDQFLWSKIVAIAAALFVWVFVLARTFHVTLSISLDKASTKEFKPTEVDPVVYEIDTIPDIVVLSMERNNEERLVSHELVFSYTNKEVIA